MNPSRYRLFTRLSIPLTMVLAALLLHEPRPARQLAAEGPTLGEDEGEAGARADWDLMRLRDPATGRIPEGIRSAELAFAAGLPNREAGMFKRSGIADYGWSQRGPVNIGGRTRALAVDIDDEGTLLAGGASGGMWRSTDGGVKWTRTTLASQLPSVTCVAQDTRPGKHNIWYYGTGEIVGGSASASGAYYGGDGIFKSTNGGRSWDLLRATSSGTPHRFDQIFDYIWKIVIDPSNLAQDEVYAATYGGISRSTNGGTSWSPLIVNANSYSTYTDVAVTDSGVVYAALSNGGKQGIWRLADGVTQTKINPPDWPADVNRVVIGIAPTNQNVVYFLAETPHTGHIGFNFKRDTNWTSLWKYTYLSGDGTGAGGLWENRSASLPSFGGSFGDYNPQFSYDMHVEASPTDENVLFIGGTNIYRSTNAFRTADSSTWMGGYRNIAIDSAVRLQLEYPNHHPDQHLLLFSRANPRVAYTGSDGGIHKTLDVMAPTVEWTPLNTGYLTSQFYTVGIDHATDGNDLIVGGLQDNGTWLTPTSDATVPWNWIGSGDGSVCAVADGRTSLYVSKQEGKAYRVMLNGDGTLGTWARVDPLGARNYLFINPFVLDPSNTNVMYLSAGNELWRNRDLTAIPLLSSQPATMNWTKLADASIGSGGHITAFGASAAGPAHRLYYGTDSGAVYRIDSADVAGNPVRTTVTGATFPKNAYVNCITVDPLDGNRAVVVFSNYSVQSVFLTTDGGATWAPIGGNLEANAQGTGAGPSCRWFTFLHRGGGTVYLIGTSAGLFSTTALNGAQTVWTLEGSSTIGNMIVDQIEARQTDGYVAIATHGSGVFSTTIAPMDVEDAPDRGAALLLDAPAPNPVRSAARVSYTIPEALAGGRVQLTLYDAAGREVQRLVDAVASPGPMSVPLDVLAYPLSGAADGAYYLRLEAGGRSVVRTVRIIR